MNKAELINKWKIIAQEKEFIIAMDDETASSKDVSEVIKEILADIENTL